MPDSAGGNTDKTTIGLTARAREIADHLQEAEGISELLEIAVIGMGIGISLGLGRGSAKEVKTIWNVGTFDGSGKYRDLFRALYDDLDTPYRQMEYVINEGLEKLAEEYTEAPSSLTLSRVLGKFT